MSRLPGMHEFCYNSWLYKVHNNFNHRKDIALINRDGSKKFTNDPHSDYYVRRTKMEIWYVSVAINAFIGLWLTALTSFLVKIWL